MSLGICNILSGATIVYQVAREFDFHIQIAEGATVVFRPQVLGQTIKILGSIWGGGACQIEAGTIVFCSSVQLSALKTCNGGAFSIGKGGVAKPTSFIPGTPLYTYPENFVENVY